MPARPRRRRLDEMDELELDVAGGVVRAPLRGRALAAMADAAAMSGATAASIAVRVVVILPVIDS